MVTRCDTVVMDVDIDLLIREIKSRPTLWETKCATYGDRTERIKQWEKVVDVFATPGMTISDKRELGIYLQKKWRNIRDSFAKERRRLASLKDGSGDASKKREYIHYDSLLFLKDVVGVRLQEGPSVSRRKQAKQERKEARAERRRKRRAKRRHFESDSYSTSSSDDDSTPLRRKKTKNYPPEEVRVVNNNPGAIEIDRPKHTLVPQSSTSARVEHEDADRCFMLSLLDDFKSLPSRLKPIVKINIMKCIMEAQDFDVETASAIDVNPLRFSPDNARRSSDTAVNDDRKSAIDFISTEDGAVSHTTKN